MREIRGAFFAACCLLLPYGGASVQQESRRPIAVRQGEQKTSAPVQASFQIMDDETAGNLYGRRISRDFYVVIVDLTNSLAEARASILVFGDTMTVRVRLEKQVESRGSDGKITGSTDYWGAILRSDRSSASPQSGKGAPSDTEEAGESPRIPPYSFQMMIEEIFDPHKGRLTDVQKRNIVLQMMQPVEEIPFGQSVRRVAFFPRHFSPPSSDGTRYRISEVFTGTFKTMIPISMNRNLQQRSVPR